MNNLPIGILGGSFDPIHLGHLRAAIEVLETFSLESVHFVPCQVPVHKPPTIANVQHRLNMLKIAISDELKFKLDEREINRNTPSYMVETLKDFRREFGDNKPLILILGLDAFIQIETWYEWHKIFDLAHIVVVSRTKTMECSESLKKIIKERRSAALGNLSAGTICFHEVAPINVSSTQIRQIIHQHRSPRYLIPDQVWTYIKQHRLYV